MKPTGKVRNALSFDVEEYFQVSNFEHRIPREEWDRYPSRLVESTEKILQILDDADVRATFFILGWNAERRPDLVRRIADAGHEIASHGFSHRLVYDCTEAEFREDVTRTRQLLETLSGKSVIGYRAPSFSITERSSWALDVLADTGHLYDSSIFPVTHPRYGWKGGDPYPHQRTLEGGKKLWEFPLTTAPLFRARLPAAGGGYLRLFPLALIRRGLRTANERSKPGVLYLHPWEFDPDQPRVSTGWLTRMRHYANIRKTAGKLRSLLGEFSFGTVKEALGLR